MLPVSLMLQPTPALAFDTGHHVDLTRAALSRVGFKDPAIKVVQFENWLVDYYAGNPNKYTSVERKIIEERAVKLHFDNLFNTGEVWDYWIRLTANTRDAVQQTAREVAKSSDRNQGVLKFLTLMGASLHAVQDFYTHSNWVETHPKTAGDTFRTETWFSSSVVGLPNIFTGAYPASSLDLPAYHGDYLKGLNKDSYIRPRWDEAYVFAYVASCEWVSAIHSWVEAITSQTQVDLWKLAQEYKPPCGSEEDLEKDLDAARTLSLYLPLDGQDGHWKGNHSGSGFRFRKAYINWAPLGQSLFVRQMLDLMIPVNLLTPGLYVKNVPLPTNPPSIPKLSLDESAVIIRTLEVGEEDKRSAFVGQPDFFAKIFVEDVEFLEAVQRTGRSIAPPWKTIYFAQNDPTGKKEINITYKLYDENGVDLKNTGFGNGPRVDDGTLHDLNPKDGEKGLLFRFNISNHICTGLDSTPMKHDSEASAFTVVWGEDSGKSDGDRASVKFYVSTARLALRQ
ncbi:MAG: hypothetical protein ACKVX9_18425 [Blastocatellia bacterium]